MRFARAKRVAASTVLLLAIAVVVLAGDRTWAEDAIAREVLVFYANETPPDILQSANYKQLLGALRESDYEPTVALARILQRDAYIFPNEVTKQAEHIFHSAARHGFDAVVFTNALARQGRFAVFDHRQAKRYTLAFPFNIASDDVISRDSPLSRSDAFRAALHAVIEHTKGKDIVLITTSHGDAKTALMARVQADVTAADKEQILSGLQKARDQPSERPPWPVMRGVTKLAYWGILRDSGAHVPLVLRSSCESGIFTFGEYLAVPESLQTLAHSGTRDWSYEQLDYEKLFSGLSAAGKLSDQLAERLRAQGIEVESRLRILQRLLVDEAASRWPILLVLPLVLWLAWYARALLRSFLGRRAESIA